MSQVINTNIMSLNAQRNLNSSSSALATSLNRLSSGLRINSAKDDAAGMAISERLTTQIRGLSQAMRNSNDGISFAQTAEGALASVATALQRIRELAVQSSNDTNSASDRQALNNEVQQLIKEISRVANSTEFNGERILSGTVKDLFFQVGANQGQMISVNGVDSRTESLGATVVEGTAVSQTALDALESGSGITGQIVININASGGVEGLNPVDTADAVSGVIVVQLNQVRSMDALVQQINVAIRDAAATDSVVRNAAMNAATIIDNQGHTRLVVNAAYDAEFRVTSFGTDPESSNAFFSDINGDPIYIFGDATTNATGRVADSRSLDTLDVSTRKGAADAMAIVDGALTQVSTLRSELGAVQVRFESTIANLSISVENLSASRSRIMDADFAAETAELTRAQILQQAGVAMLAQANQVPQNVLSLLRG